MPHHRRVALFVASILIPAAVFAGLGLELYRQQRELIVQRLAAEQSQPLETLRLQGPQVQASLRQTELRFAFYAAAIVFALSVTLFSRYIVWREMRQEGQLAAMRAQFVSNVSHELRTPLTSIQMFAETLALGRVTDPERQRRYLDTIARESQRVARMVDDVLTFSKMEAGAARFRQERIPLAAVLESALRAMEYPLEQGGFRIRVIMPVEALEVRADADALEQAVLNIMSNAMKFSGASRDIEIRLSSNGKEATIEVADGGIGIPAEHRERIFERFFRIPLSEHQAAAGVGIGLTLVDGIMRGHNGRVEVRGNEPKGTVVSLHLPLENAA
ncbi:MAG TPA: ATP-binding protein [Bryobacteraceae bacterium]|nr:ATP-binding protein [Bryobacteraceae bacterium]